MKIGYARVSTKVHTEVMTGSGDRSSTWWSIPAQEQADKPLDGGNSYEIWIDV